MTGNLKKKAEKRLNAKKSCLHLNFYSANLSKRVHQYKEKKRDLERDFYNSKIRYAYAYICFHNGSTSVRGTLRKLFTDGTCVSIDWRRH